MGRQLIEWIDPTPPLTSLRLRSHPPPSSALLCIYRPRNRAYVEQLVQAAVECDVAPLLWALDETLPSLEKYTYGSGQGWRFSLLNRLTDLAPPTDYLVIADDDVKITRGSLATLLQIVAALKFDLAQPGHTALSYRSHLITRSQLLSVARRTSFVEIGPIVVIGPGWRQDILPFPEGQMMGWGTDIAWSDLEAKGCRLGIVDAVRIRHVGAVGGGYDNQRERAVTERMLEERGVTWPDLQVVRSKVRPWESLG